MSMYVKVTYDGKIESTSNYSPNKKLTSNVGLDGYCELVVEVKGGPISYYDNSFYNVSSRGKIKSIGDTKIKYFDDLCYSFCAGKVERIGNVELFYYNNEAGPAARGKVKYIDDILVEYYDNSYPSYKAGKPKKVGNKDITIL